MAQKESQVSRKLKNLLRSSGFFVFKTFGSSESMSGLPDLIGVKYGRFFAIEVKILPTQGASFRYSEKQVIRMQEISEAGGVVVGVGFIQKHNIERADRTEFYIVQHELDRSRPMTATEVIKFMDDALKGHVLHAKDAHFTHVNAGVFNLPDWV